METVSSLPFGKRTWAYWGLHSKRSTSWATGSYLDERVCFFMRTRPPANNHWGNVVPMVERRWKLNSLSCGVAFVAVHNKERTAFSESGRTTSQYFTSRDLDFGESVIACHRVAFSLSTCPFPSGLYGVVRLVATSR